jgi:hypothetical protein
MEIPSNERGDRCYIKKQVYSIKCLIVRPSAVGNALSHHAALLHQDHNQKVMSSFQKSPKYSTTSDRLAVSEAGADPIDRVLWSLGTHTRREFFQGANNDTANNSESGWNQHWCVCDAFAKHFFYNNGYGQGYPTRFVHSAACRTLVPSIPGERVTADYDSKVVDVIIYFAILAPTQSTVMPHDLSYQTHSSAQWNKSPRKVWARAVGHYGY